MSKIRFVVNRMHVSTPPKKVAMKIARMAIRGGGNWENVDRAVDRALAIHAKNREQYQVVTGRRC